MLHGQLACVSSCGVGPFRSVIASVSLVATFHSTRYRRQCVNVQVVLEAKGVEQLRNLSEKLAAADVVHKLWVEQPENVPTALATQPCRKSVVGPLLKKFNLCKGAVSSCCWLLVYPATLCIHIGASRAQASQKSEPIPHELRHWIQARENLSCSACCVVAGNHAGILLSSALCCNSPFCSSK